MRTVSLASAGLLVILGGGGILSLAATGQVPPAGAGAARVTPGIVQGRIGAGDDGRLLVGDWEPPDAFLLAYQSLWEQTLNALLDALQPFPVYLLSQPSQGGWPGRGTGVIPLGFPHESAWVRDYGPLQMRRDGRTIWMDPSYHAERPLDAAVPERLARRLGVPVERVPYRLEGGGIASDGGGLCAMTSASAGRLGRHDPREVADRLGCRQLVIVPALSDEPTGHVDLLVHFLGPEVVAVGALETAASGSGVPVPGSLPDPDAVRLDSAARLLRQAAARAGRHLQVVRVPIYREHDGRLFSYLNVVSLNDALLVPVFREVPLEVQARAHRVLRRASGKRLIAVPADDVVLGGGGLHCIVLGLYLADGRQ